MGMANQLNDDGGHPGSGKGMDKIYVDLSRESHSDSVHVAGIHSNRNKALWL